MPIRRPTRPGLRTEPSAEFVAGRAARVAAALADTGDQPTAWCHEKEQRIRELALIVAAGGDVRTASHVRGIDHDARRDRDGRPTAAGARPAAQAARPGGDGPPAGPGVGAVPALPQGAGGVGASGLPLGWARPGAALPGGDRSAPPVPAAAVPATAVTAARVRVLPAIPDRPWFTSGQVARLLGVGATKANRLIDTGVIAGYRVPGGAHRRVTRGALLEYATRHGLTLTPTEEPSVDTTPEPTPPPAQTAPAATQPADHGRWRLDTPAADAVRAVSALTPEDLADCLVQVKLVPGKDRFAVYRTGGGETTPAVSVTLPDGSGPVVRLLVLRFLHELSAVAGGERFAA